MSIPDLIPLEDPVLKQKAELVTDIASPGMQQFIDELMEACTHYEGVGIAAPQVGKSIRLFIMASGPNLRYPDAPKMEMEAVINPQIKTMSEENIIDYEGCLSVPGYRGQVNRAESIEVEYVNRNGVNVSATFEGFIARIFQHEYDHLEGIIYPMRMEENAELITIDDYHKLVEGSLRDQEE
ncbi:MAG: peptide deformylase [Fibrobacteria bacterium]|nr:peptide deformylase [Fibrobacteria bacterium]